MQAEGDENQIINSKIQPFQEFKGERENHEEEDVEESTEQIGKRNTIHSMSDFSMNQR